MGLYSFDLLFLCHVPRGLCHFIRQLDEQKMIQLKFIAFYFLSKAARGRPEGPTERSVLKIIFVMLAIFRVLLANLFEKTLLKYDC